MICIYCAKEFDTHKRNNLLPDFSSSLESPLCIDCLIEDLRKKRTEIYPLLVKALKKHERIKKIYFSCEKKSSELDKRFRELDYEHNLILHNKNQQQKQPAEKPKSSIKLTSVITIEQIQKMLANLTPEQQASVMATLQK